VTVTIPQEEIEKQYRYMSEIKQINDVCFAKNNVRKRAIVRNFGCQMNEHDAESLSGMILQMGYELCDSSEGSDLIIFNTCCVRENAELKVYGLLGALKKMKKENPDMVIAVCGCMTEQPQVVEEIKKKFKNVELIFGTHNLHRFPELLCNCISNRKAVYETSHTEGEVAEGLPILRENNIKAWVTIMYGCNNFCSYCIVPYVRGRERSRDSAEIIKEIQELEKQGIKEVTLLGQNVNSYGKDKINPEDPESSKEMDFADLLTAICENTKIERIRFLTSHPKDLSDKLISVMAKYPAICKYLHLPVQSGSTKVLKEMNRRYTKEQYLNLIEKIRMQIPSIAITTDIIVGFPGETDEDFEETLNLVEQVRYESAYTFIYSKRQGTPAAEREDQVDENIVKEHFNKLIEIQNRISREINDTYLGKRVKVLVEGKSRTDIKKYTGRTQENKIVNFESDIDVTGRIVEVEISNVQTWSLDGNKYLTEEI